MAIQESHLRKSIQIAHPVRMSLILTLQRGREEESQLGFSIRTIKNNICNLQSEESVPSISSNFLKVILESCNDICNKKTLVTLWVYSKQSTDQGFS